MRITAAAPAAILDDCNDFAMVLAFGPADNLTYRDPSWQDAEGNLYAVASFLVRPEWISAAQAGLVRPEWDTQPYVINMAGANRAQAALVFWHTGMEVAAPQAATLALTAIGGADGRAALAMMGLFRSGN
ncbi:hypothetical protein [Pseudophaeobacter sp.]|uniref:hypothetical protein n=1 Tax=Pseudophaeobacter sp. TaxID=1971739 RepID=UPI003A9770D5